jgi:hypothetical protein
VLLEDLNKLTHKSMLEIIPLLAGEVISPVVTYPGFLQLIESGSEAGRPILSALRKRM